MPELTDCIAARPLFARTGRSILIGTGGGRLSSSPRLAKCWVNRVGGIDFSDATEVKPEQEWELLEAEGGGQGAVEYPVRMARFANVSSVDLFFVSGSLVGTEVAQLRTDKSALRRPTLARAITLASSTLASWENHEH